MSDLSHRFHSTHLMQAFTEFNLSEPYFTQVYNGAKTFECRLYRDKWKTVQSGHMYQVRCKDNVPYLIKIISVVSLESFKAAYVMYGNYLLPNERMKPPWERYYTWYSPADEATYGVVVLELQVL